MNVQALLFLGLVANQLAATIAFLGIYLREPGWRRTAVGRHLLYWPAASAALDVSWLLLLVVKWPWLAYVLLAAQAVVGGLTWYRAWLAWRARR